MRDLICFSHLRWGAAAQRPHHLMRRAARDRRVWFVEEPMVGAAVPRLHRVATPDGVRVCVPHLPDGLAPLAAAQSLAALLEHLVMVEGIDAPLAWLFTPAMLPMVECVEPRGIVYDSADDASARASPEHLLRERRVYAVADLVFMGSRSLFEARRAMHEGMHLFPSCAATDEQGWDRTWADMDRLVRGLGEFRTSAPQRVAHSTR